MAKADEHAVILQEYRNCRKLRAAFEGREAIFTDKGVLRVRVSNIRFSAGARQIVFEIEEIPTIGLECGLFHSRAPNEPIPLRDEILVGALTSFSDCTWHMGYGGWALFFKAEIVEGLTRIASEWPAELDAVDRYEAAMQFLMDHDAYEQCERVFLD